MVVAEGFGPLKTLPGSRVYLLSANGKRNMDLLKIMGVTSGWISQITNPLLAIGALELDVKKPGRPFVANPEILVEYIQASDLARMFDETRPGMKDECEELLRGIVDNFLGEYYSGIAHAIATWESWPKEYRERIPFELVVHTLLNAEKSIFAALSEHILSANLLLVAEEMQDLKHEDMLPRIQGLAEDRLSGQISTLDLFDILRTARKEDLIGTDEGEEREPEYSELFKKYVQYNSKKNELQREIIFKVMRGENIEYLMGTADILSSNRVARIMLVSFSNQEYYRSEWFTLRDLLIPKKARVINTQADLLTRAGGVWFWNLLSQVNSSSDSIHSSASRNTAESMWNLFSPIMTPELVASSEELFHFGMKRMLEDFTKGYLEHEVRPQMIAEMNGEDVDGQ